MLNWGCKKEEIMRWEIIFGRGQSISCIYVLATDKEKACEVGRAYSKKFMNSQRIQACNKATSQIQVESDIWLKES